MPIGERRERVLFGIGAARATLHRYTLWRWAIGIGLTTAIALVPLTGVLRIDLWSGRHLWLGEEVGLVQALKSFAFPFLAINVVIILLSRFVGRYLCGFVCPVGALARLAEWLRWSGARRGQALLRHTLLLACCALIMGTAFSFWVDWRVFLEGSDRALAVSSAILSVGTLALYLGTRWIGLRFCRDWCPSGVYFAVLGPKTQNGVEFANPASCTDCHACEQVCPVDLLPREMATAAPRAGTGFYPDGLSNWANCLRCGDCIAACEGTTSRFETPTPLRIGWLAEENTSAHAPGQAPEPSGGREHT